MKPYPLGDPTPGEYDHRGGTCPHHGDNIVTARLKGQLGAYFCVQCLREVPQPIELPPEPEAFRMLREYARTGIWPSEFTVDSSYELGED